jgi:hypothetical protein
MGNACCNYTTTGYNTATGIERTSVFTRKATTMKCKACGVDVDVGGVFCHRCGERLDADPNAGDTPTNSQPMANSDAEKSEPATATNAARRAFQPRNPDDDAEDAVWRGGYSAKAMLGSWIGAGLLSIALLVGGILIPPLGLPIALVAILLLWLVLGLTLLYRKWNVNYELTSQPAIPGGRRDEGIWLVGWGVDGGVGGGGC